MGNLISNTWDKATGAVSGLLGGGGSGAANVVQTIPPEIMPYIKNALDTVHQRDRLKDMAKTGGADELKDALALDIGMGNATINNQFGGNGVLNSARNKLTTAASADAAKAKYAQQVIANKAAAEQAIGNNIGNMMSTVTGATSALTNLGTTQRNIEQQKLDAPWTGISRYISSVFGNPAKQQGIGGK